MWLCDKDNKGIILKLTSKQIQSVLNYNQHMFSQIANDKMWLNCDCRTPNPRHAIVRSSKNYLFLRNISGHQHSSSCHLAKSITSPPEPPKECNEFTFDADIGRRNELERLSETILELSNLNSITKNSKSYRDRISDLRNAVGSIAINNRPLESCLSLTKSRYLPLVKTLQKNAADRSNPPVGLSIIYLTTSPRKGFLTPRKGNSDLYIKFKNTNTLPFEWNGPLLVFSLIQINEIGNYDITESIAYPLASSTQLTVVESLFEQQTSLFLDSLIFDKLSKHELEIKSSSEAFSHERGAHYRIYSHEKLVCAIQFTKNNHDIDKSIPTYPIFIGPSVGTERINEVLESKRLKIGMFISKFVNTQ